VKTFHVHPAWLPVEAFRGLGSRSVLVIGPAEGTALVRQEVTQARTRFGGQLRHRPAAGPGASDPGPADVILALTSSVAWPAPLQHLRAGFPEPIGDEGYLLARRDGCTVVLADDPVGLLYGWFHLVRLGERAFGPERAVEHHRPALRRRMLQHWDNVDVHPVTGQVERGYAGGSLFWADGRARGDLDRVRAYARLLAACGINAVAVNNVNVHATEAHLLTDRIGDVAEIADRTRPFGIRTHLSVSFAAPVVLGGLSTADPLDPDVRTWWAEAVRGVYAAVPDFGGFVVKADSEGQPGPFAYRRTHAEGANLLAGALAPYGGVVHWRAFVYNHRQDWRDRRTDRARAAYDHFAPLAGQFRDNAIVQVKHGPIDFQLREPVSPVIAALPGTRVAVELQVTQEYTGQQQHVCYLASRWSEVLRFRFGAGHPSVNEVVAGGGLVGVSNAGPDPFWTGHPLAQANLYALGRLAWDPDLAPVAVLDEWIDLTFPAATDPAHAPARRVLHALLDESARTYESYTAPLGLGFMVRPGHHYGPDVDGYEYTPWGTYHFADRDGVGVDRTRATGTSFTGQYPLPWSQVYESLEHCPDELLLFFHHVPYTHVRHDGSSVIQHIYDTHFDGFEQVAVMVRQWDQPGVQALVGSAVHERVAERLQEQCRCAREWRDQVTTYFYRKSGIPDVHGRVVP
jgi:alpha-glucuronidase